MLPEAYTSAVQCQLALHERHFGFINIVSNIPFLLIHEIFLEYEYLKYGRIPQVRERQNSIAPERSLQPQFFERRYSRLFTYLGYPCLLPSFLNSL